MRLPRSNTGAAIGALLVALFLAVVQGAVNYAGTGQPLPSTNEGWVRLLVTICGGAVLSTMTPRYSVTEQRSGYRTVNPPPSGSDAPVVTEAKAEAMERDALRREADQH